MGTNIYLYDLENENIELINDFSRTYMAAYTQFFKYESMTKITNIVFDKEKLILLSNSHYRTIHIFEINNENK